MKKVLKSISAMLLITIMLGLVGCGMPKQTPKEFVEKSPAVTSYVNQDEETINKQVEEFISKNTSSGKQTPEKGKEFMREVMKSMKVTVDEGVIDEKNKTATVKLTYEFADEGLALKDGFTESFKEIMKLAFSGKEVSDEEGQNMLFEKSIDAMKNNPDRIIKVEAEIELIVEKSQWKFKDEEATRKDIEDKLNAAEEETIKKNFEPIANKVK